MEYEDPDEVLLKPKWGNKDVPSNNVDSLQGQLHQRLCRLDAIAFAVALVIVLFAVRGVFRGSDEASAAADPAAGANIFFEAETCAQAWRTGHCARVVFPWPEALSCAFDTSACASIETTASLASPASRLGLRMKPLVSATLSPSAVPHAMLADKLTGLEQSRSILRATMLLLILTATLSACLFT